MKIKLQDFARECGVTDRAVQKHLQKHEEALRGHFERRGPNGTWLDDFAQDYIRSLMIQPPPAVVSDTRLVLEAESLQKELAQREEKITSQQEFIDKLLAENAALNNTIGRLEGSESAQKLLSDGFQGEIERANQRAEKAIAENSDLKVQLARQEAREEALMKRGLLARILNRSV